MENSEPPPPTLLAVDVGARCGMALFGADGRLLWHRAQSFSDPQAMRRAVRDLLAGGGITWLITQGDVSLAAEWERVAMREGVRVQRVSCDHWQARLLAKEARKTGVAARRAARDLARRVIEGSGASAAGGAGSAEAILVGLWGAMSLGWLGRPPPSRRAAG